MRPPCDTQQQLRMIALELLARRDHSCFELEKKLLQKAHQRSVDADVVHIQEVISRLAEDGYQSDSRFAQVYASSRARRGFGPIRIANELRERGVASDIIEDTLASDAFDWQQLSEQVRMKKFGRKAATTFEEKVKQLRFLQYRGFTE